MAEQKKGFEERFLNEKIKRMSQIKDELISGGELLEKLGSRKINLSRNSKGCDIGYALAANSCERANNVDACTVTALDATTAFAVPDPDLLLAELVGFFGSGYSVNHFTESRSLSLLRIG
ncbi:MAG TPA: hypothetical protein VHA06_15375 [Candidatus Angelobacter sp.]|nr:hypothetical protein [Candidatus Angelobacter sp.]